MATMHSVTWHGTLHLASSLAHGGKSAGNLEPFRRETLILPTGQRLSGIPMVSGGGIRGALRRVASEVYHRALTDASGTLPMIAVNAIRSGGALRETRTDDVLTAERQAAIRDLCPMLAIFGTTGPGRIMSGRLIVDKGIPLTRETLPFAPDGLDVYTDTLPSIREIVQHETFTRVADIQTAAGIALVDNPAEVPPTNTTDMFFTVETLMAGTHLLHSISLEAATPLEIAFMDDVMGLWQRTARIGAHRSRGLGKVTPRYTRAVTDLAGRPAKNPKLPDWEAYTRDNRDRILAALTCL